MSTKAAAQQNGTMRWGQLAIAITAMAAAAALLTHALGWWNTAHAAGAADAATPTLQDRVQLQERVRAVEARQDSIELGIRDLREDFRREQQQTRQELREVRSQGDRILGAIQDRR